MPACPRSQIVAQGEVGIYHCYNRCVRRAFLCGYDPVSGKNFDHRKDWIQQRLELLAGACAIEVLDFALLDNHIHVILRNRPDVVERWSDQEVVRRWWQLCPTRRDENGEAADPRPCELEVWLKDPTQIEQLRGRLSSISWFMRLLCQKIARLANRQDQVTGKFWEARFKSQALLDEQAVLACSMYVDLNVIRAGKAKTPEESRYTSVYERIMELKRLREAPQTAELQCEIGTTPGPPGPNSEGDLWLCPIQLANRYEPIDSAALGQSAKADGSDNPFPSRRLTNKGFLPMTLQHYLCLLDWAGRELRSDKRGAIPAELAPILERLRINQATWPDLVYSFGKQFHSAVGRVDSMAQYARRNGRRWIAGVRQATVAFT